MLRSPVKETMLNPAAVDTLPDESKLAPLEPELFENDVPAFQFHATNGSEFSFTETSELTVKPSEPKAVSDVATVDSASTSFEPITFVTPLTESKIL